MKTCYLSLGSNLGDRECLLRRAVDRLNAAGVFVRRVSSIYETEPQDLRHQPWFLNLVVEAETALFPRQLLLRIQKIERELGRERRAAKGPRTIDIDILFYGSAVMESPELRIPHPGIAGRRFVLEPLAELSPHLKHPVLRKTISDLLKGVRGQRLELWTGVEKKPGAGRAPG